MFQQLKERLLRRRSQLKRKSSIALAVIAVVLFAFNFKICEYFYPGHTDIDNKGWWYLKSDILAICFCLALILSKQRKTRLERIIISVGIGWSISDVIDRVFFDVRYFTVVDILMIVLTIIYAIYEYYEFNR